MNATNEFEAFYITKAAIHDFEHKEVWRDESSSSSRGLRASIDAIIEKAGRLFEKTAGNERVEQV